MNKKIATISLVLIALLVLSIAAFGVSTATSATKPKIVEEREAAWKNPAPLDNAIAPVSGSLRYYLNHGALGDAEPSPNPAPEPVLSPNERFNLETGNLPQNEQTIASWTETAGPNAGNRIIVGGSNDYRGDPDYQADSFEGLSGYYVSEDDGASVLREGALPKLTGTTPAGTVYEARSWGDPVIDVYNKHGDGTFFYSSIYIDGGAGVSALGLARAKPNKLLDDTLLDSEVWEVTPIVSEEMAAHFHDKEWVAVDNAPTSPNYGDIYVSWTAFDPASNSRIWLARCTQTPFACTVVANDINPVSAGQMATQGSMVNVDSEGRVIVTWTEYIDVNPVAPYYRNRIWYRVYAPGGGAALTPPRSVELLDKPVTRSWSLQGNEFRVPLLPSSEVANVNGVPRLIVAYQKCSGKYLFDIPGFEYADTCSNSNTYIRYVDNYQSTSPKKSSAIGMEKSSTKHGFFPTLSVDAVTNTLNVAWYQSESTYKHDLYVATEQRSLSDPATITGPAELKYAGDPDAETYFVPYGLFIGDYFQIYNDPANGGTAYVHFTGNSRYTDPHPYTAPWGLTYWGGNNHDNRLYKDTYP